MVYARTKLLLHDDLLRPSPVVSINCSGKDPTKFYKEIPHLLYTFFRIPSHAIQEKKFEWHKGETEKFSIVWEVDKDLDKFSYLWIEVKLEGRVSKTEGEANITVEGAIRTEYPQDTLWQKSIFYEMLKVLWHSTFYHSKRSEYSREGKRMMANFVRALKTTAGV